MTIHTTAGICFFEIKCYFSTRCNGWHDKQMVDYLLEQKIIAHTNIKYTVQAQLTITHYYYNNLCNRLYNAHCNPLVDNLLEQKVIATNIKYTVQAQLTITHY